jgi:hypothetical protein
VSAKDAKYKTYTRAGRPDQIAQVQLADLQKIGTQEWKKEPADGKFGGVEFQD